MGRQLLNRAIFSQSYTAALSPKPKANQESSVFVRKKEKHVSSTVRMACQLPTRGWAGAAPHPGTMPPCRGSGRGASAGAGTGKRLASAAGDSQRLFRAWWNSVLKSAMQPNTTWPDV